MLVLKIKPTQASDCRSIIIRELTGTYSATTNPTGWELPNIPIATVQTAELQITTSASTTPIVINVYPTLPTVDDEVKITVTNAQLNYPGEIPTQLIRIKYLVTGINNGIPFTVWTVAYCLIDCQFDCCWQELVAQADPTLCGCDTCDCGCDCNIDVVKASNFRTIWMGLQQAVECPNPPINKINRIITYLSSICNC